MAFDRAVVYLPIAKPYAELEIPGMLNELPGMP